MRAPKHVYIHICWYFFISIKPRTSRLRALHHNHPQLFPNLSCFKSDTPSLKHHHETSAGETGGEQKLERDVEGEGVHIPGRRKKKSWKEWNFVDEIVLCVCFSSPFSPTIYSHHSQKPGRGRRKGEWCTGGKKVKNAIYQEHFTQELRFGSICVSHWKCHLTKGVVDNTTARTYAERKLEGEYR